MSIGFILAVIWMASADITNTTKVRRLAADLLPAFQRFLADQRFSEANPGK
jgi:hypothetical protein